MDSHKSDEQKTTEKEAVPGTPIVRSNTPRPFMYSTMTAVPASKLPEEIPVGDMQEAASALSTFPAKPPSAPPLPEEPETFSEQDDQSIKGIGSEPEIQSVQGLQGAQEFAWLFEYGLEMDNTLLNTPERFDGLALLYGPAVLKGYRLYLGSYEVAGHGERTGVTILPDARPHAEVWGVLYRVPQTIVESQGDEPALADIVHVQPQSSIQAMHVFVQETYRNRTLPCITYGWRDTTMLRPFSAQGNDEHEIFIRRLISIAKKQRLPEAYSRKLAQLALAATVPDTPLAQQTQSEILPSPRVQKAEQQTEPLAIPVEKLERIVRPQDTTTRVSQVQRVPIRSYPQRWFVAFALYLFCLLLGVLALAIVQGVGIANDVLNEHFTLLNVPWLVLVYGLLGGCISSLVTLGRSPQPIDAPIFVIVTWFTRPFVGAILALLAYLLLNSGIFLPTNLGVGGQHEALFLLLGALAGVCEGWLFLRK